MMNRLTTIEPLLTVEQVARILQVSKRTIYRWVGQRRLPPPLRYTRISMRWRSSDFQKHLESLGISNPHQAQEEP